MTVPLESVAVIAAACVVIGAVGLYAVATIVSARKKKKRRRSRSKATTASTEAEAEKARPSPAASATQQKTGKKSILSRIGVMNIILLVLAVALVAFTLEMIELFKQYGMVPDTLIQCVFVAVTGECGFMGWIKTNKEKYRDRKWQKEDMREANMAAQMPAVDPTAMGTPKE